MEGTFLNRLYQEIIKEPFRRKIVLAPSFTEGQSWLLRICREHGRLMNVEVQTVHTFVTGSAQFSLYKQGITLINQQRSFWIIHNLMGQMAAESDTYIPMDQLKPGIVMHVHKAIMDLRHAGVKSEDLQEGQFLNREKGRYMRSLLSAYELWLEQRKWTDSPGLLKYVTTSLPEDVELLMSDPMLLSPVAARMVERLADDRIIHIKADPFFFAEDKSFPLHAVEMFHATGKLAEVREALRRIIAAQIPLDEVEMIVSDAEYALAVSTLCISMNLPCSFAEGLPLETTRMGRAVHSLLNWLESGYQAQLLLSMLKQQLLSFSDHEQEISNTDCIRILERSGIGWGKERYVKLLDPSRYLLDEQSDQARNQQNRLGELQREHQIIQHLSSILRDLFPDDSKQWTPAGILGWLVQVLDQFGVSRTEEDVFVLQEVRGMLQEMEECPVPTPMSLEQALLYTRDMLQDIRAGVQPLPKPGFMYLSGLVNGGVSGRKYTFLLGMDEHSWSGSVNQNPMLLDEERLQISTELLPAVEAKRAQQCQRDVRLGMISGSVTFSFSSYDLADGTTSSPAFQLLQLYRRVCGDQNVDYHMLYQRLGEPIGYLGAELKTTTTHQEVDIDYSNHIFHVSNVRAENSPNLQLIIESVYPTLRSGRNAFEARESIQVTEFDGYVAGEAWSTYWGGQTDRTLSASQLEKYAECPMRYFFQYVLGIRAKEMVLFDRFSWLKPNEKGTLLHEVFRRYMSEVSPGNPSAVVHDHNLLLLITEETITAFAECIPAPSPHVFEKERESIYRDVEVFYRMETQVKSIPQFFEQELLVDETPLHLELDEGMTIQLRGIVDRIDQIAPHQYRIIDYKTGSPKPFKVNGMFAGGTQLQHALYAMGTEVWMRQTGVDLEATVLESAYVFPSERGRGQEVLRSQTERHQVTEVIRGLLSSMEQGIFIPTSDLKTCGYCDYAAVCGDHAQQMVDKRNDESNRTILSTLLEVENLD